MSSVLRSYARAPPASTNVILTGGNGSDRTTNVAKAFIDIRRSNIFVVDISKLEDYWNILFQGPPGATGSSDGKTITIVFKGITSGQRSGNALFSNDLCPTVDENEKLWIDIYYNGYTDTTSIQFVCIGDRLVSLSPTETSFFYD